MWECSWFESTLKVILAEWSTNSRSFTALNRINRIRVLLLSSREASRACDSRTKADNLINCSETLLFIAASRPKIPSAIGQTHGTNDLSN